MAIQRIKRTIKKIVRKITGKPDQPFFKSYSQEGEDMILRDLFQNKADGFYVDVGAFDPVRISNTKHFYDKGWRGINIEPSPLAKERFNKFRSEDINLTMGVSEKQETLNYYMYHTRALNTFDAERVKFLSELKPPHTVENIQEIPVNTLEFILNKYAGNKTIDFMNIDVEWREMQVLTSNDWEVFRPKYLLVEILDFDIDTINNNQTHRFLEKAGYKFLCKTPRTCFYEDIKND